MRSTPINSMMWYRSSSRLVYRSVKSICLPTVFSASENLAWNSSWSVSWWLARSVPTDWATLMTSCTVLLTLTKNRMRMSARMLSRQISPSRPDRLISMVFTEMSMTSALCRMGSTTWPVKETSTRRVFDTIRAWLWSTLRYSREKPNSRSRATITQAATSTPRASMAYVLVSDGGSELPRGPAAEACAHAPAAEPSVVLPAQMVRRERPFAHCRFPAVFTTVCMPDMRQESVTGASRSRGSGAGWPSMGYRGTIWMDSSRSWPRSRPPAGG
ncbi:exported hypothetical protein [Streptomyces misionensis JCM 4497]